MRAVFDVEVDVSRSLLRLRLQGFFSVADVRAFAAVRNAALQRLRCAPNRHLTLCDARGGMLSRREVAAGFQRLLADPRYASRRLAYVADGALAKMQANRVLDRPHLRFFDRPAEAEAWLLTEND